MSDLFSEAAGRRLQFSAPLAQRLRPVTLDDFVGQDHIVGPGRALRLAIEQDSEARAIMRDAEGEEFKHFAMNLEYLFRRLPLWREIAQGILFTDGDIVEHGEESEEEATEEEAAKGAPLAGSESLGIGDLRSGPR